MKFAINGNEIREITMKTWEDDSGWSHDFFQDMEVNFPQTHELTEGDDAYICTEDEYTELLAWWQQWAEDANAHRICENGDDYTDYEGPEFFVFD